MTEFLRAYIACALWSSHDESTPEGGEPMDRNYDTEDLAPETLAQMRADCEAFLDDAKIVACVGGRVSGAGHDFWLTRNHHGAGFWDGDWPEPDSDYLDMQARKFPEVNLYVGDDGKIYC